MRKIEYYKSLSQTLEEAKKKSWKELKRLASSEGNGANEHTEKTNKIRKPSGRSKLDIKWDFNLRFCFEMLLNYHRYAFFQFQRLSAKFAGCKRTIQVVQLLHQQRTSGGLLATKMT